MKKFIVTISREFGSGGRLIGRQLAEQLNVPFYDKELIELAAEKSGLSTDFIARSEERATSSFALAMTSGGSNAAGYFTQYDTPTSDRAYFAQSAVITELAEKESCIIVGRGAGYILRENPDCVSILFHAPLKDRVRRAAETYGLEEKGLADKIKKIDKGRDNFLKRYSGTSRMDPHSYDLCIDTGKTGIDGAVEIVLAYLKQR